MRKTFLRVLGGAMTAVMLAGTVGQFPVQAAVENGWEEADGNRYWYEGGVKQGTEGRGKEIYDPGSDAWYWLDSVDGGKMAVMATNGCAITKKAGWSKGKTIVTAALFAGRNPAGRAACIFLV